MTENIKKVAELQQAWSLLKMTEAMWDQNLLSQLSGIEAVGTSGF